MNLYFGLEVEKIFLTKISENILLVDMNINEPCVFEPISSLGFSRHFEKTKKKSKWLPRSTKM